MKRRLKRQTAPRRAPGAVIFVGCGDLQPALSAAPRLHHTSRAPESVSGCGDSKPPIPNTRQYRSLGSSSRATRSDLSPLRCPDGWGRGYGSYREKTYRGEKLLVTNAPNINAKTIRGLVAAPNHIRTWRRGLYLQLGGHNHLPHVADDLDLLIRTFLTTTRLRIPKLCYLQYQEGGNTQRIRNKDIQCHVGYLRSKCDNRIHGRFEALNVHDWIWN